ncbi:MAG: bifunctional isocitrate dehydrogenase kinase/phosphatase [Blastocatellia bacterium]|nr:bifunctional isocitrate dehydrogenase kinase/phosphatase [Blastocatellia bacterium]
MTTSRLANLGAEAVCEAFESLQRQFHSTTARARQRFETRDWAGLQADAAERLSLYTKVVNHVVARIRELLENRWEDLLVWVGMKAVYSGLIENRDDWELAETFFNSVTRRIFTTVGVNPQIEFVDTDYELPPTAARSRLIRSYSWAVSATLLLREIFNDLEWDAPFENLERDLERVADRIDRVLEEFNLAGKVKRAEIISSIFYRGREAYLVGRLFCGGRTLPLALAFLHKPEGIVVDAVLLTENDVSLLFSFTRSYFLVDTQRPYDMVAFLKSIMPRKRRAELYISMGLNKHGKTELYRDLLHHLEKTQNRFEVARGERGMVMAVFTMPDYDVVIKIIKDHFAYPKNTTRKEVMSKYHLIFKHDRVGRLVDAQEFEFLEFQRRHFSESLLRELLDDAGQTVTVKGDSVVIKHAYLERRLTPLNLFLTEAPPAEAAQAVIDCGHTIKDLMTANIFAGDILLKNFGVTRQGRVVFYDYDEVCLLTDCRFRAIPPARYDDDDVAAEPWFSVQENDVFPEEFENFFKLRPDLHRVFCQHHSDLFTVSLWKQAQERIQAGELVHLLPYREENRLG